MTVSLASDSHPSNCRHRQRGASLLESLIAFVVLAGSTVTVAHLQSHLRLDADLARQRSEAVRIGEAEMESLRDFTTLVAMPGVPGSVVPRSYDGLVDAERNVDAGNASYRIVRSIDAAAFAGARAATVSVFWTDRGGATRQIALASVIAGSDPAHAGALGLGAGAVRSAPRGAFGRSPAVPADARDLGDGRSVWKPSATGELAVVIDNASAEVVAQCVVAATSVVRDLGPAELTSCTTGRWLLSRGTIRFTAAVPPDAGAANDAPLAVLVSMAPGSGTAEAPRCSSEAQMTVRHVAGGSLHVDAVALAAVPASAGVATWDDSGERFVAWTCLSPRDNDSDVVGPGRVDVAAGPGWTIGRGRGDRRVCRQAANPGNFLVVRGDVDCPER
ncbi:MAG: hypothetical protein ABI281_07170 [Caldimonas sp.]